MAESFSREKLRHAPQKEGGWKVLCDLPPVRPRLIRSTNLMSRMNGKKTHTALLLLRNNRYSGADIVNGCKVNTKYLYQEHTTCRLFGSTVRGKAGSGYICINRTDRYVR